MHVLVCPSCREEVSCLHHGRVEVFERPEDAEDVAPVQGAREASRVTGSNRAAVVRWVAGSSPAPGSHLQTDSHELIGSTRPARTARSPQIVRPRHRCSAAMRLAVGLDAHSSSGLVGAATTAPA